MAKKTEKTEKAEREYKSLDDMMAAIQKKHGDGSIILAGAGPALNIDAIKTGAVSLDIALGIGGIPVGRIIEIYGMEGSGKTTLSLSIIKECQKAGGVAAFVDAEHALDIVWAKNMGVDVDHLMVSQPDSGEEALQIVEMLAASKQVQVIIVDSVAALIPQAEIDGEIGDHSIGSQARLMSQAMRKLKSVASRSKCSIIFTNQIRMKIGVMFGNPETTPGGNALKFYSSVRIQVSRKEAIKDDSVSIGNQVSAKVVKNKVAPPFKTAIFPLYFGLAGMPYGIDHTSSLFELATDSEIVEKHGSSYSFGDIRLGNGKQNAIIMLRENPDLVSQIEAKVFEANKITLGQAMPQSDGPEDEDEE